jgi:small GTP-binding protein
MNEILKDGWSVEECIDIGKLLQYTTRITQYDAMKREWPGLRELHLLGASDYRPKDKRLEPGCYVNREESWLLIIGAKSEVVNRIVSRYGAGLEVLDIRFTDLEDFPGECCPDLRELKLRKNEQLRWEWHRMPLPKLEKLEAFIPWGLILDVGHLGNLKEMILQGKSNSVVEGVSELQQLKKLELSYLSLGDALELDGMTSLETMSLLQVDCKRLILNKDLDTLRIFLAILCQFSDLDFLHHFPNVEDLDLRRCNLPESVDLSPCRKLKELNLWKSSVKTVWNLPAEMRILDLDGTKITQVPDCIRPMKKLEYLSLGDLRLRELPEWLGELPLPLTTKEWADKGIFLHGTQVEHVEIPPDLELSGTALREWLASIQPNAELPLNEIKVVFLGDGEAGKSHVVQRLMQDGAKIGNFDGDATPGIAIHHNTVKLPDRTVKVHYWDFGGQEILHAMHRIFLTQRTVYVVVLNARNDTQDQRARFWLRYISSFDPAARVLLVLNKTDQNPRASINETELRRMYPQLPPVVRLSAKEDSQEDFNEKLTKTLENLIGSMENLRSVMPSSWRKVKQRMEQMQSGEKGYIDNDDYDDICEQAEMTDDPELRRTVLRILCDLGLCFRTEDVWTEDYLVLRPDWVTNAIYKILFNRLMDVDNGIVPVSNIQKCVMEKEQDNGEKYWSVSDSISYERHEVRYILDVMRAYHLSFDMGDKREFIPMLCQRNAREEVLREFVDAPDSLEVWWQFDYLPDSVLFRLMVQGRVELETNNVWLTGAVFGRKETEQRALVLKDGNILKFYARGNAQYPAKEYLESIEKTAYDILKQNFGAMLKGKAERPEAFRDRNQILEEYPGIDRKIVYKADGQREVFDYRRLKLGELRGIHQCYSNILDRGIPAREVLTQGGQESDARLKLLVTDVIQACMKLQGNRLYRQRQTVKTEQGIHENPRNTFLRDLLDFKNYHTQDQTLNGVSLHCNKAGELDILIKKDPNTPWAILEALNHKDESYWQEHLVKLLEKYNPQGIRTLFLVTYVGCMACNFGDICDKYADSIPQYATASYKPRQDSFREVDQSEIMIRAYQCSYLCGSEEATVYHIFVYMGEENA